MVSRRERRRSLLIPGEECEQGKPPEGGWGWMVTLGMAIMFISTTGQYTAFGLLFDEQLGKLDANTTGATIIMNALAAAVNFSGLVTNYLLQTMSFRMVAVIGGLLFSVGVMLTVFSDTVIKIVITYSIVAGVGLGLVVPSSYLAFNTYFLEKRALAMGLCQAAIGLGFMAAPPLCQYLLEKYTFRGTMLLLGGIALNSVVGAMLYQPVKWHLVRRLTVQIRKDPNDEMEDVPLNSANGHRTSLTGGDDVNISMAVIPEEEDDLTNEQSNNIHINKSNGLNQINSQDMECDEHIVISRRGSLVMSAMLDYRTPRVLTEERYNGTMYSSTAGFIADALDSSRINKRPVSASLTNFSSNVVMFDNSMPVADASQGDSNLLGIPKKRQPIVRRSDNHTHCSLLEQIPDDESDDSGSSAVEVNKHSGACHRGPNFISQFIDLSLLNDHVYLNICLGLSLSFVSDSNFFTVFPSFLESVGFSGSDIALCISIAAGADVVSRLVLPWLATVCNITPRTAYLIGCLTSAIARSIFVSMTGDFMSVAVMLGVIGFLKGAMAVNLSLTIAQHCSLDKFAGAFSLYMVVTGVMALTIGSLVGVIRDLSGSFPLFFHILSGGLMFCAIMWLLEYALEWNQFRRRSVSHAIKNAFCRFFWLK